MTLSDLSLQFEGFLDEAKRLRDAYKDQIDLLIGLETEHITSLDLQQLQHDLERFQHRIQYLVGSVHHVNGIPIDFDRETYEKSVNASPHTTLHESKENFLCAYFEAQYQLLQQFFPEVIGHFDLCRLYEPDLQLQDFPKAWALVNRNVSFAVEYGALFELNAAAFRKGWKTAYPGEDVVKVRLHRATAVPRYKNLYSSS